MLIKTWKEVQFFTLLLKDLDKDIFLIQNVLSDDRIEITLTPFPWLNLMMLDHIYAEIDIFKWFTNFQALL